MVGSILWVEDDLPYICFLRVGNDCDCDDDYDGAACVSGVLCESFSYLEQCIHSYNAIWPYAWNRTRVYSVLAATVLKIINLGQSDDSSPRTREA